MLSSMIIRMITRAPIRRKEERGKCILEIRGARPFFSDKFDITKHKNYKLLSDYNKKNAFDIEKYLKRKDKVNLKENMKITVVDMDV